MWKEKVASVEPIEKIEELPLYAYQFFFRNLGPFRSVFWDITVRRIVANICRFLTVYLLSDIISRLATFSIREIFTVYLPLFLAATICAEVLDRHTRRVAEALPIVYSEHLNLRFYRTILGMNFQRLFNLSKERLAFLVGRYTGHVQAFLGDWIWAMTSRLTNIVIIVTILYCQSPIVLFCNLLGIAIFLFGSFRLSTRFSEIARDYSQQMLESSTIMGRFFNNLNTVKRLGIREYASDVSKQATFRNWDSLERVRHFHAYRWFIQLNIFNAIYFGTLFYGIYQVRIGVLPLGFLLLIKYSFDQLWGIVVYAIEYYVQLVQQRQDTLIIRDEFKKVFIKTPAASTVAPFVPTQWQQLELRDATISFTTPASPPRTIAISAPHFTLKRSERIGIIGESGAGKSTILSLLANLFEFDGQYLCDARSIKGAEFTPEHITIINNFDPLFALSLRDNIVLGRDVDEKLFNRVIHGVCADEFLNDPKIRIGDADVNLSSGQEQRIRLARGLLQSSDILLLDEPFTGIDDQTKASIIAFLREFLKERTVVLVTHNREELKLVERVYEVREGVLEPSALS